MTSEDDAASIEESLLHRFLPYLKYDSQEAFFADAAEEWTINPPNVLRRAPAPAPGRAEDAEDVSKPEVLASADPDSELPRLSLELLGRKTYGNSAACRAGDHIADLRSDYRDQYVELRKNNPELRNRIYGRVARGPAEDDRAWLQYWFYYFYNDYRMAGGIGLHEGDWEMIQLRMPTRDLSPDSVPVEAVYAQHRHAQLAVWEDVETLDGERPVVYVGRGSHASYFEPGIHETEVWIDVADGQRVPKKLNLEIIPKPTPGWLAWPGRWGDTQRGRSWLSKQVDQPSPQGPCAHGQWHKPDSLLRGAVLREPKVREATTIHRLAADRLDGRLRVKFDFSENREDHPERLVVNVNSENEPDVSPRAFTFVLDAALKGVIETRIALEPTKNYDVNLSTINAAGAPSGSVFEPLRVAPSPDPPVQRVLRGIGSATARVIASIGRALRPRFR